ncbi:hypothetical protein G6O67_003519 [Ophiocordyceps sinensis]|uniref:Uncharacterized protein n=1 Tax=Ophiocordyceps sinensis TaxID=72228 RepID=A0A8H4PS36_9HYPO|nr:hypothetical protein G6O67_003519 [Ophiocordyceps sinensis]
MPWRGPPVADFDQQPQYRWQFWQVGLQEDDLFGELHQRFNTMPHPGYIQDPDAFHNDVASIARDATDKQVFLAHLQKRRDERLAELSNFRHKLFRLLRVGFTRLSDDQLFHLSRHDRFASLDTVVGLYASLLAANQDGQEPSLDRFLSAHELRAANMKLDAAQPEPSPPSEPTEQHTSAIQSIMPTPPHQTSVSSTQAEPAAPSPTAHTQPIQENKKRKASPSPKNNKQRHAKRQRIEADQPEAAPAFTTQFHGSVVSDPPLELKAQAVDGNIGSNDQHSTNNGPNVSAAAMKRRANPRTAETRSSRTRKRFAGTEPTPKAPPKAPTRRARGRDLELNPAGSLQTPASNPRRSKRIAANAGR